MVWKIITKINHMGLLGIYTIMLELQKKVKLENFWHERLKDIKKTLIDI